MRAPKGAFPLGAVLAGCGAAVAVVVGLLHLDRLPVTLCVFKAATGIPCLACGTTRALGRLFAWDVAGAVAVNPLAVAAAVAIGVWGTLDLALATRSRALAVEVDPSLARALRVGAVVAGVANWVYLVAAGV